MQTANEEPPYILVAHSLGGHTARIYTTENPEEVAGLVLVDTRLPAAEIPDPPAAAGQLRLSEFLARVGLFRLVGEPLLAAQSSAIAEHFSDYPYPIVLDAEFFETARLQSETIESSDERVQQTGPFGELPLVVIAHDIPDLFGFLPPEERKQAEIVFQEGQEELTNLSTNSTLIIADGSGHNIPVEQPETIVMAVQQMLRDLP